jgi:gliding motility-associated-like protein
LSWQKFPNFDFSEYQLYRDLGGNGYRKFISFTNINDTILKLSGVDALKRVDCYKVGVKNLCSKESDVIKLVNHCTIELKGRPSINASVLNWTHYIGWDVNKYVIFRQKENYQFDSIGQVDGKVNFFIDSSISCHKVYVYRVLGYENNGLEEKSWSDTCRVKPIYINTVRPPVIRRASVLSDKYINLSWDQFEKNRVPLDRFLIKRNVNQVNSAKWWSLTADIDSFTFNDFLVDVDKWSYKYKVLAIDTCGDSSQYTDFAKSIVLSTTVNNNLNPELRWSQYGLWTFGVKEYIVERNENSEFREIARVSPNDTIYVDELLNLNCRKTLEYRITAMPNRAFSIDSFWYLNSVSNVSKPNIKTKVFLPNAFTPNSNDLNEIFKPEGVFISDYWLRIYNRWGEKIYENNSCSEGWNGTFNGEACQEGIYIYKCDVKGTDGQKYILKGDVTLLR